MLKNNNMNEIFGISKSLILVELDPKLGFRVFDSFFVFLMLIMHPDYY